MVLDNFCVATLLSIHFWCIITQKEIFMQEYIICSDGKKRKATRVVCENCGKEALQRTTSRSAARFCSQKCGSEHQSKTKSVSVTCRLCNKVFRRKQSSLLNSKSGLYFCSRACKDEAQKLGGVKEIQPPHFGTRTRPKPKSNRKNNRIAHRKLFQEIELVCARCGYKEFSCSVDIHHKDFNHLNNDKSNLLPLCANCHRSLHYNRWEIEDLGVK
jgi:hypothetical protein